MKVAEAVQLWWEPLVQQRHGMHLSLFVPMERGGIAAHANLNRWRQGLRLAEAHLVEAGASEAVREELLGPARASVRVERALPESFDGLAYFAAPGFFQFVSTPFTLHEAAHVGPQFQLRPLLPLSKSAEHFYVLALSLSDVRVLEGSAFGVRRIELPEMPTSFAAATGYLYDQQRQLHSASSSALGERSAIVHGQGGNADDCRDRDLEHYFRRLWEAIAPLLPERNAPIVLAAVESYLPLVTAALRDARLVDRLEAEAGHERLHRLDIERADYRKPLPLAYDGKLTFDRLADVYNSGAAPVGELIHAAAPVDELIHAAARLRTRVSL